MIQINNGIQIQTTSQNQQQLVKSEFNNQPPQQQQLPTQQQSQPTQSQQQLQQPNSSSQIQSNSIKFIKVLILFIYLWKF
mgnify:CR=1 FL=1